MLRSVVSNGALRFALLTESRRNLAIMPTVKKATDTSAEEFPAPSHVNLAADATAIARDYREFFTNPDSSIELSESTRTALAAELAKKSKAIPDSDVADSWIAGNMKIPKKLRLGDNPLFKAYNTAK